MTFLTTTEDLAWLHEVHGINVDGVACAILYGNEDAPERVETYATNDYREVPIIFQYDESLGRLCFRGTR